MMPRLFSYVVKSDFGFAPNPHAGVCTLATCKPQIRRTARIGDWLIGTGSNSKVGKNRVIYVAKIDEIINTEDYGIDPRFTAKQPSVRSPSWRLHGDNIYFKNAQGAWVQRTNLHHEKVHVNSDLSGKRVLIARRFWYFGSNAPLLPDHLLEIIKSGPGHKRVASKKLINAFETWITRFDSGIVGQPNDFLSPSTEEN